MDIDFNSEQQFQLADDLIKEDNMQEAINVLHNILAENPHFGKAHNHLGWIYETKFKAYADAEKHYLLAMKLSPEYPATYINYVYYLYAVGQYDKIEDHLLVAEKVPGVNKATIINEWGIYYETKQRFEEAIEKYKQYLAMSFDNKGIETAQANIERCKKKIEILKNN